MIVNRETRRLKTPDDIRIFLGGSNQFDLDVSARRGPPAYLPPRESCVRDADRAAVDKSFWWSRYAIARPSR